jgi:hypothetical protein
VNRGYQGSTGRKDRKGRSLHTRQHRGPSLLFVPRVSCDVYIPKRNNCTICPKPRGDTPREPEKRRVVGRNSGRRRARSCWRPGKPSSITNTPHDATSPTSCHFILSVTPPDFRDGRAKGPLLYSAISINGFRDNPYFTTPPFSRKEGWDDSENRLGVAHSGLRIISPSCVRRPCGPCDLCGRDPSPRTCRRKVWCRSSR